MIIDRGLETKLTKVEKGPFEALSVHHKIKTHSLTQDASTPWGCRYDLEYALSIRPVKRNDIIRKEYTCTGWFNIDKAVSELTDKDLYEAYCACTEHAITYAKTKGEFKGGIVVLPISLQEVSPLLNKLMGKQTPL